MLIANDTKIEENIIFILSTYHYLLLQQIHRWVIDRGMKSAQKILKNLFSFDVADTF